MKHLILICLLITPFSIQQILAQKKKQQEEHPFAIGGYFSYQSQNGAIPITQNPTLGGIVYTNFSTDVKGSSFSIAPYISRKFGNHWLLGLSLSYATITYESRYTSFQPGVLGDLVESKGTSWSAGVYSRYIVNPNQNLKFYLQPQLQYSKSKDVDSNLTDKTEEKISVNAIHAFIQPGVAYALSDHWSILATFGSLSYAHGTVKADDPNLDDSFSLINVNTNLTSLQLGLEYRF